MYSPELSLKSECEANRLSGRDAELLAGLRAGSSAAFEELQKVYSNRLYSRILSITRNHADAEYALQETFMRAFVGLNSFEGRSHLSTWLTRIAFNSALMVIRRRRTGEVLLAPEATDSIPHSFDIRDSAPNPEEICNGKQTLNRMFKAIGRLDPLSPCDLDPDRSRMFSERDSTHTGCFAPSG
jgi:RNA polymerase sigma-70 factor (ECF subfamily)